MLLTNYEIQYMGILRNIYENGYEDGTNERTGISTKRLPCVTIRVDVEKEFPVLKTKKVFVNSAEHEIFWIWQQMSNNIHDLKPHIWDQWADKNGSIGKAYGYQLRNPVTINVGSHDKPDYRQYPNQPTFILEYLREFPQGRWAKGTLWNPQELKDMHLCPCVHGTDWNLDGGRLNLVLTQRSGDMPYGVPFNTTQYAMLMHMFARDLGVKPGILCHVIADAHIYANQMEGVKQQLEMYEIFKERELSFYDVTEDDMATTKMLKEYIERYKPSRSDNTKYTLSEMQEMINKCDNCKPAKFEIDENITSFWDMTVDNAKLVDYYSMPKIDFGSVAV